MSRLLQTVVTKYAVPLAEKQETAKAENKIKKDKEDTYEKTKNKKNVFLNTTHKKGKHNSKHKNKTKVKNHTYHTKQTRWNYYIKPQALKLAHIPIQKKEKIGKIIHHIDKKKYMCNPHPNTSKNTTLSKKSKKPQKNTTKMKK